MIIFYEKYYDKILWWKILFYDRFMYDNLWWYDVEFMVMLCCDDLMYEFTWIYYVKKYVNIIMMKIWFYDK